MRDDLTGPALHNIFSDWAAFPKEDLYQWIRNSQQLIASEHPRAVKLWEEWNPTVMDSFPNLKDDEIEALLLYIDANTPQLHWGVTYFINS